MRGPRFVGGVWAGDSWAWDEVGRCRILGFRLGGDSGFRCLEILEKRGVWGWVMRLVRRWTWRVGSEEVWGIDLKRLASWGTGVCMMRHRLKGKLGLHQARDCKDIHLYEY